MTTTLTARSPEDVLAIVPVVLGFTPRQSLVMLTFGAAETFHARVDLPADGEEVEEVIDALLDPARRHRVPRVLFVLYCEHPVPAERLCRRLVRAFRGAGIEVCDVLRADGRLWFRLLGGRATPRPGVPYDVSTHPFAVQAVLDGRVTHPSREALAATLAADPARVQAVERCRGAEPGSSTWVRAAVARHALAGTSPDDPEAARLLEAIDDPDNRDAAWRGLERETAAAHVDLWWGLVRRAPEDLVGHAAAVLGIAAWVAGDGALAWCAVDRAITADPDHSLARLVGDLLTAAVPPTAWEGVIADELGPDESGDRRAEPA